MTRLIDADALDQAMYHKAFEVYDGRTMWNSGCWIRYKIYEEASREAPTIEAVPVRHGKWLDREVVDDRKDAKIQQWQQARCSCCNKWHTTPYMYYFENYDYCPNCGAKMDAEREEE